MLILKNKILLKQFILNIFPLCFMQPNFFHVELVAIPYFFPSQLTQVLTPICKYNLTQCDHLPHPH